MTIASHPFVTCAVLDPQLKRIAEYAHVRALTSDGGRSQRDKLGHHRSTKSIIPPSSGARPLQFIAQIVKRCLQHDFVARVN